MATALYILPPELESGAISGKDDAEEEEAGTLDDICTGQLKSACELFMRNGKRITTVNGTALGAEDNEWEDELSITDSLLNDIFQNSYANLNTNELEESCQTLCAEPSSFTDSWVVYEK